MTLECVATAGIPEPAVRWANQPTGSTVRSEGNTIFLTIPSLTSDTCVQCVGISVIGQGTDEYCLEVDSKFCRYANDSILVLVLHTYSSRK